MSAANEPLVSAQRRRRFAHLAAALADAEPLAPRRRTRGKVQRVIGGLIRASVPEGVIGEMCLLRDADGREMGAEIVGLSEEGALLMPFGAVTGVGAGTEVIATGSSHRIGVGEHLLGRVIDGMGRPVDGLADEAPRAEAYYPSAAEPPDPMDRPLIERPLALGVRALDALLTCGEGQRMGIFAAAGGGKSTLLGMLAKNADVDVIVVGLIGERGREVREFIEHELGADAMARSVIVVSTSDRPAVERAKAAYATTAVAEYFRDRGKRVLLLMDSVTRFARALREIGLAAGEAPTRRGFPSSVFAALPRLLERSGNGPRGSITAFYTVLVEGDDVTEPVADETRSILDGHVMLSRKLIAAGHYPAIDVQSSVSRSMARVASAEHRADAERVRALLAGYDDVELLLKVGEYKSGSSALADEAIDKIESIRDFLRQDAEDRTPWEETLSRLGELAGRSGAHG